ncbi:MAG: AAA family ATPase [Candidatus Melainabacteria bacterium]|nr:AAA family ATPase [Candidatus Melainabacteria bacterium]
MFQRQLEPLLSRSFFIFGARGTGKSTFLKQLFDQGNYLWFDLLDSSTEEEFAKNPSSFKEQILAKDNLEWVVVDEIQKLPKLLDLVHQLIESSKIKFALTGSSARKLKRGSANLLAGRAFMNHLFPLTSLELEDQFSLDDCLNWGSLPEIFHLETEEEKQEYLRSYAQTYLKEEIWAEHIIRKLDPFRRFLEVAAQSNCEIVNFSNIAKDVGADTKTVQSYYQILEDTLLGFLLEPYSKSIRKQQRQSPKFYFFDIGVKRSLDGTLSQKSLANTYAYGKAFEHWVITEIYRLNHYLKKDFKLSYLLTKDQAEIDLIIERPGATTILLEIKSTTTVDDRSTRTLKQFKDDIQNSEALVLSQDPKNKLIDGINCYHWQEGLKYILF